MIVYAVLTTVNVLAALVSWWCASKASAHRALADLSQQCASSDALVAKTSADILSRHSRAAESNWPEASGR